MYSLSQKCTCCILTPGGQDNTFFKASQYSLEMHAAMRVQKILRNPLSASVDMLPTSLFHLIGFTVSHSS
jgi:hypothetical protein